MQQEATQVRKRRWRPARYWPTQMLALGIVVAPAALLLLELALAPTEFEHSPKLRVLALGVACVGMLLWLASELIAAFSRPKAPAAERPAA
jgi:hypothetical protein